MLLSDLDLQEEEIVMAPLSEKAHDVPTGVSEIDLLRAKLANCKCVLVVVFAGIYFG